MRAVLIIGLAALAVAGCGFGDSTPTAQPVSGNPVAVSLPSIRALSPADFDGNGVADTIPHPALRRILVQAPQGTPMRLTRGGVDIAFEVSVLAVPGGVIHELTLAAPIGSTAAVLTAGSYSMSLSPSAELATGLRPILRPMGRNALANDLVQPESAVFESPDEVGLLLSGALPPVTTSGLLLQSGDGTPVPLLPAVTTAGVVMTPQSRLLADRVYTLVARPGLTDSMGNPYSPTFRLMVRQPRSQAAIRLAQADIDRDGNPDLLCLFADGSLTIVREPGAAQESLLPPGTGRGIDLCVGDFDGNGALDIAVLRTGEGGFHLVHLINTTRLGNTTFDIVTRTLPLEQPVAIRAADFDRDARDDIAIVDAFGTVHLLLSGGARRSFSALGARRMVAGFCIADAGGDGKPDLCLLGADGTLHVCHNTGAGYGTMPGAIEFTVPGAQRVSCGVYDGDRSSDFVFSGMRGLVLGLGGSAQPAVWQLESLEDAQAATLASGVSIVRDLNRDSRGDVLVMREDALGVSDDVAVFMNGERQRSVPDAVLPLGPGVRLRVHAMELWRGQLAFAADTRLLLMAINTEGLPPTAISPVRFVEGFAPVPQIPAPMAATVADFNDDGRADIAAIDKDGKLRIWLSGEPGQPFEAVDEPIDLGGAGVLKAIDFDKDNAPDLLFIPTDPGLRPRVLRNVGRGRMDEGDNGLLPQPPTMLRGAPALGDFDRDGSLDVLWPCPHGRVQFNQEGRWRDGRETAEIRDSQGRRLQFSGELACADFTGDGIADVAAVMQFSEDGTGGNFLVLLQGTGDGRDGASAFRPIISEQARGRIFRLTPADFDGDGRIDLAIGFAPEGAEAALQLLRLRPDLQFVPFEGSPRAKGRLLDLALDDMDRDGDFDLIASEDVPGEGILTTLWINNGRGIYVEGGDADASLRQALGDFRATNLSLADFTGDGRADLLAADAQGNVTLVRSFLP